VILCSVATLAKEACDFDLKVIGLLLTFQDVSERSEGSALKMKLGITGLSSLVPYSLKLPGSVPTTTATQIYFAIFSLNPSFFLHLPITAQGFLSVDARCTYFFNLISEHIGM